MNRIEMGINEGERIYCDTCDQAIGENGDERTPTVYLKLKPEDETTKQLPPVSGMVHSAVCTVCYAKELNPEYVVEDKTDGPKSS